mmetsp:Transcript_42616/g.107532  ORF Transcript_42616/g.107532 Transcript_42616/m.107532 type:complete len:133 (-) Transcript_42616:923-1321(-)
MFACVAIVGKKNNPLFLRSFNSSTDELKFHYIVHSALDVVSTRETAGAQEPFLGLLFPTEEFRVYGYLTNTRVKLLVVVQQSHNKDTEVKAFLERLHSAYIKAVSNPFHQMGEPIESQRFEMELSHLVALAS